MGQWELATTRILESFPQAGAAAVLDVPEGTHGHKTWDTAISDNGNCFVSNVFKDIMSTFSVEVRFTPTYHAATNSAIERRHQTIKNSLKAVLVDMGNTHKSQWMRALPWVLMGKRA